MKPKIKRHFEAIDPLLHRAIDTEMEIFSVNAKEKTPSEFFVSLCRSIIGQQLSGKAAHAIYSRFEDSFPRKNITAKKILERNEHELRELGMSYAKARALLDYSEKYVSKNVRYDNIHEMDDEHVKEMLLQIKGVGPWTTEMFLMFALGREDVFSPKDLGLQKGIQKIYGLSARPDEKKSAYIAEKWKPYRTYASIILWHTVDTGDPFI